MRLCGYGYSTKFFEDTGDGKALTTNQKFGWQFYSRANATAPTPILFLKQKAPGTFRIFILGESAAAGTPDPAFGFARQMELMLRDQYPGNPFEVINAAMRGIDSHIIRQIAGECAELSPDLFIIYAGNNEQIGLHAPSPGEFQLTNLRWLRFQHALKRTKLAQLGESFLGRLAGDKMRKEQDMEFFRGQRIAFDDPKRDSVYGNYAANLRDICRSAKSAEAEAIVCSVAVNLHDFPPLGSLHQRDWKLEEQEQWKQFYSAGIQAEARREFSAALTNYESAARLDDHFAELLFRMARCFEAVGKLSEAQHYYALARDWDALPFRTDSRLNGIIHSATTNAAPHVHFVDVEKLFAASLLAENGVPGAKIFYEHVHLKFDGDYLLASSLVPAVAAALKLSSPSKPVLSRQECARRLACTRIDEANMEAAMARLTANPPFLDQLDHAARQAAADADVQRKLGQVLPEEIDQVIATHQQAIRSRPDDWMLHFNLGNLLNQVGRPQLAVSEFAEVVKRLPRHANFRIAYANALRQSNRRDEAAEQFAAALKIDPQNEAARQALDVLRRRSPDSNPARTK